MKPIYALTIFILVFSALPAKCQKYDFSWPLGYITQNTTYKDSIWGISFLNFDSPDGNPTISRNTQTVIELLGTNASLCSREGYLLFLYDGRKMLDGGNNPMPNSNQISNTQSSNIFQNGLGLPMPGFENNYILLHQDFLYSFIDTSVYGGGLLYSIIGFPPGGGFGAVTSKRNVVSVDTVTLGKISAVRHANGRDWWTIVKEIRSNRFYFFLVDTAGVHFSHEQNAGPTDDYDGWGQAVFSPDGSRYCSINASEFKDSTTYVNLFDFDRCLGSLSNYRQYRLPLITFGSGAAFSPNGRFLYLPLWRKLYQIDLEAPAPDTVLIDTWDGFLYTYPGTSWSVPSTWGPMANGPDGRIYSINYNNGFKYLNLIERPNLPGAASRPRQHALEMPTLTGGPPNFANYRLGPVDGSACDSLGIDNIPWAWWRFEQDTALYGTIYFTDLSAYEPTHWYWDFGDGTYSPDTSPVHAYAAPGTYTVCLTVSNAYGADSLCRTIHIATVPATQVAAPDLHLSMLPNPFRDRLTLQWSGGYLPGRALCRLFDVAGRQVAEQRVYPGWNTMHLPDLPPGLYAWTVSDGGWVIRCGKVVKME